MWASDWVRVRLRHPLAGSTCSRRTRGGSRGGGEGRVRVLVQRGGDGREILHLEKRRFHRTTHPCHPPTLTQDENFTWGLPMRFPRAAYTVGHLRVRSTTHTRGPSFFLALCHAARCACSSALLTPRRRPREGEASVPLGEGSGAPAAPPRPAHSLSHAHIASSMYTGHLTGHMGMRTVFHLRVCSSRHVSPSMGCPAPSGRRAPAARVKACAPPAPFLRPDVARDAAARAPPAAPAYLPTATSFPFRTTPCAASP